jgi:hypothetical protein
MGIHHEDGYSAAVEGYFVVGDARFQIAKSNGRNFVLAEPCELSPGTIGELLVIVDGAADSRLVELPTGVSFGQTIVQYRETAPF